MHGPTGVTASTVVQGQGMSGVCNMKAFQSRLDAEAVTALTGHLCWQCFLECEQLVGCHASSPHASRC